MKQIEMGELTFGDIRVPGGWLAWVPEMTDPEYTKALEAHYMRLNGGKRGAAQAEAEESQVRLAQVEFLKRLRLFVKRTAETYARGYPETVQEDGSLAGYDPETLQTVFVPYDSGYGRAGKIALRRALSEMAASVGVLDQFEMF